jgi:zinc and cadmium transporter
MSPDFGRLAIYSGVIVLIALLGGVIPWWGRLRPDRIPPLVSASAGVLLGTALFHLLPEGYEAVGWRAVLAFLLGLGSLLLLEKRLRGYGHGHGHVHGEEHEHTHGHEGSGARPPSSSIAAFVGLALHSLFDGVALAAGSGPLQGVVLVALIAHKAPTGFSLSAILRMSGVKPARGLLFLLAFALFVPLGAFGFALLPGAASLLSAGGYALAFSAGNFFHVAVDDLLPEVGREATSRTAAVVGFVIGLAFPAALLFMPHVG